MAPTWILLAALATLVPPPALSQEALQWWQTAVFYQIYPRSFMDSDGDGIGDLEGIRSKLDYIKSLGVGAVWLSPIYKSPMADFGYDISDFKDIADEFGTLDQFDKLVKETHEKGLKLVMDFVPNHSSDEHEWFVKGSNPDDPTFSKYRDYYVWREGQNGGADSPNNWMSVFGLGVNGDGWENSDAVGAYYLHQFDVKQPDLNYRNPEVVQEMKDVIKFWLDRGVDGFRVDAIPHLFEDKDWTDNPPNSNSMVTNQPETYDMVAQWRELLDTYPEKVMMVEAYASVEQTMEYFGSEERPAAHFPFNFFLISDLNLDNLNATTLDETIHKWVDNVPEGKWNNWVVGNHDNHRVASRLGTENVDAINMVIQLLPGSAITYNGEELGMENNWDITYEEGKDPQGCIAGEENFIWKSRDFERAPFQWDDSLNSGFSTGEPWLPVNKDYPIINVAIEEQDPNSHLNLYKKLTQARNLNAIQHGNLVTTTVGTNVFAFSRTYENDVFVIVLNLGDDFENVNLKTALNLNSDILSVYVANIVFKNFQVDKVDVSDLLVPAKGAAVLTNIS